MQGFDFVLVFLRKWLSYFQLADGFLSDPLSIVVTPWQSRLHEKLHLIQTHACPLRRASPCLGWPPTGGTVHSYYLLPSVSSFSGIAPVPPERGIPQDPPLRPHVTDAEAAGPQNLTRTLEAFRQHLVVLLCFLPLLSSLLLSSFLCCLVHVAEDWGHYSLQSHNSFASSSVTESSNRVVEGPATNKSPGL